MVDVRRGVREIAESMEKQLQKHDYEFGVEGWFNDECTNEYLFDRLDEQVRLLIIDYYADDKASMMKKCANIGNFAMMVHDKIKYENED